MSEVSTGNNGLKPMNITPIHAFTDNYIWAIEQDHQVIIIDPGDHQPVIDWLTDHSNQLLAIWVTHHHADHIGGVKRLVQLTGCQVYAHPSLINTIPASQIIDASSQWEVFGHTVKVLSIPGHTQHHLGFIIDQHCFCGDTLFSGGCGRAFYDPVALFHSLALLGQLPDQTLLYPAHEYTHSNLQFALSQDPHNQNFQQYAQQIEQKDCTLPTTISQEKLINPFLASAHLDHSRPKQWAIKQFCQLRSLKDQWISPPH